MNANPSTRDRDPVTEEPPSVAPPTLWQTMIRPRWILAFVFAVVLVGIFGGLAQWQTGQAVRNVVTEQRDTETLLPLTEVAQPGGAVSEDAAGRMVEARGEYVLEDFAVLEGRLNAGVSGVWVTGHLVSDTGGDLAVAVGWAADREAAQEAAEALSSGAAAAPSPLVGRYLPAEAPVADERSALGAASVMAPAELVNLWTRYEGPAFSGYLVAAEPAAGLVAIDSPPPVPQTTLNWLNVFYAVEWVVFAGFALYFWYRLVRDDRQRTIDQMAEEAGAQEPARPSE